MQLQTRSPRVAPDRDPTSGSNRAPAGRTSRYGSRPCTAYCGDGRVFSAAAPRRRRDPVELIRAASAAATEPAPDVQLPPDPAGALLSWRYEAPRFSRGTISVSRQSARSSTHGLGNTRSSRQRAATRSAVQLDLPSSPRGDCGGSRQPAAPLNWRKCPRITT